MGKLEKKGEKNDRFEKVDMDDSHPSFVGFGIAGFLPNILWSEKRIGKDQEGWRGSIRRIMQDGDDAKDICQETFIAAYYEGSFFRLGVAGTS